ncbi:MAG: SWIM zinc finger family protein [Bacteroidota bacterium]
MFTDQLLRQFSTAEIFAKGQQYHEQGRIRNLTKRGQLYQAEVSGTSTYFSQILLERGEIQAYCTCPYEAGHWCKHLVAVGLAIAQGEFEEKPSISYGIEPLVNFVQKYVKTSEERYTHGFVEQVLGKNPFLQAEFLRYVREEAGPLVDIPTLGKEWAQHIREEEENFDHQTEKNCLSQFLESLDEGHYDTAGQYWLTAYEAKVLLKKDKALLRAESLLSLMASHLEDNLRASILSPKIAKRLLEILFSRWDLGEQGKGVVYAWEDVAWLLENLCADQVSATFIQQKFMAYTLSHPFLEPVKEKIWEILGS